MGEKSENKNNLREAIIFTTWKGIDDYRALKNEFEKHLAKVLNPHFYIFLENPKKITPDQLPSDANVFSAKDFNLFGKIKNGELNAGLKRYSSCVLLCSDISAGKYVKKLIDATSCVLRIGFRNESLPNFDLAFQMDYPSREKLFEQTEKYLNKIKL
ncbi:MAG: hypothetical protein R3277_08180 [Brumimicrobium sp.]|nr:hypothetical protein [Brumimicrobium sp.]